MHGVLELAHMRHISVQGRPFNLHGLPRVSAKKGKVSNLQDGLTGPANKVQSSGAGNRSFGAAMQILGSGGARRLEFELSRVNT